MMDPPFDVLANVRRLIRLLRESGGGTIGRVASQSNTRRWEGSLCVSEEDMSLLFILSHFSSARRCMSQNMDKIAISSRVTLFSFWQKALFECRIHRAFITMTQEGLNGSSTITTTF
jgi:hypothetical protein